MTRGGPYRAFARAATSPRPASTLRRVLACLGGLRDRLDGRKRRLTMLGLAKRQPGAFAVLMHGVPGDDDREPVFARFSIPPSITAREARRTLRCLDANERAHVAHQVADCWTCQKLLADEDPCGFPHGRLEDLATKRIASLIHEGKNR